MAASSVTFLLGLSGLLILGQFGRIELFPWPSFYLHDLWLSFWAIWLTIDNWQIIRNSAKNLFRSASKLTLLILAWLSIGWLMALISGDLSSQASWYVLRFGVYTWVFYWWWRKKEAGSVIKLVTVLTGVFMLLWGLGQYLWLPDMRFLSISGWDDHFYRLVGTQFDPNFMGLIFALLFLQLQTLKVKQHHRGLKVGLLALTLLGVALTFSRSTFFSLAIVMGLRAGPKLKQYWPILLLILLIWLVPKPGGEGVALSRTATIESRLSTSKQQLLNLQSWQWVVGRGLFNTDKSSYVLTDYRRPDHANLPDNFIILILQSSGVVGLILIGLGVGRWMWRLYQHTPEAALLILTVLIHSLFNNSLFQPFIFIYLSLALIGEVNS